MAVLGMFPVMSVSQVTVISPPRGSVNFAIDFKSERKGENIRRQKENAEINKKIPDMSSMKV